jgi:SsrA-binding protein
MQGSEPPAVPGVGVVADKRKDGVKVLATNRSAGHQYRLMQRFEAGIVLTGTEVKSARQGKVNLKDAYARVRDGEVFLFNAHISPYAQGNRENHEPMRTRKLLLHAREIRKLARETVTTGLTLVATRMYLKNGRIKVELAVARGKKLHDKRETSRKREVEREMARARGSRSLR